MQLKYRLLRNWCDFTFSLEQLWKLFSLKNLFSSVPFQLILIDNDIKTVYLLICQAFLERTCTFMSRRIISHMFFFFFAISPPFQAISLLFSLRQVCRTKHVRLSSTCFVFLFLICWCIIITWPLTLALVSKQLAGIGPRPNYPSPSQKASLSLVSWHSRACSFSPTLEKPIWALSSIETSQSKGVPQIKFCSWVCLWGAAE